MLQNGSIISSLVTYANSVRDTVEKAIASQQDSIASKLVEIADSLTVLSSLTQRIGGLETKVVSLEALLITRTTELEATEKKCELLHDLVNKQTDLINSKFSILENLCKNVNAPSLQSFTISPECSPVTNPDKTTILNDLPPAIRNSVNGPCADQHGRLVISSALDSTSVNIERLDFAHAVLSSVRPSIDKSEIINVQQLNKFSEKLSDSETKVVGSGSGGTSALLVKLSSRTLANQIMNEKHKITGLNTQHLDITPPGENTSLPAASIFINEYLDKKSYLEFQNLKTLAKRLQIKYVWHRQGRFLARMRDGERAHTFSSPTDLQAIAASNKVRHEQALDT